MLLRPAGDAGFAIFTSGVFALIFFYDVLFEVLGGWVATVPELDVKTTLGRHCYHHAWHAELWVKRLPELREMNPERLTVPANDEIVAFMEAVTAATERSKALGG